jgi:DNA-binding beta-propeller fold protein YncE
MTEMGPIGRWGKAFSIRLVVAAAVAVTVAWVAPVAFAQNRIYWTNFNDNTITFANLDGSGGFGTLDTTGVAPSGPEGVAIDTAHNRIYWANAIANTISFANLSGGGGGTLNTTGATLNEPFGVAIDPTHGRIYWANANATTTAGISFASLNGSGGGDLNTGTATIAKPVGVAIDPSAGKIYWANWNNATPMAGKISFAFLDGTGGGDLATTGATVTASEGVAIDPATNRIYWANQAGNKISFANLNGIGGGDVNTTGATVNDPSGVAIDAAAGKIYWANQGGGQVSFANLNGSGGGDLNITGSTSSNASQPALLEQPLAVNRPVVTGGPVATTQLGCTTGAWGPDLFRSLLYQAPQRFSFSWIKDGSTISGANSSLLSATSSGSYQCRVTATNFAGSTTQTSSAFHVAPATSNNVSLSGSTSALTASLTVTCHGIVGQRCSGPIVLTSHVKKKGKKVVGVTARKHKHKHKHKHKAKAKTVLTQVMVGSGAYSVGAGSSANVQIPLNQTGKQLLGQSFTLPTTVSLPGTTAPPLVIKFRLARIQVDLHSIQWGVATVSTGAAFTLAHKIVLTPLPAGAHVHLGCHGGGCPFAKRSAVAKKKSLNVTKSFGQSHLKPGTKVTFAITAVSRVGEFLTYTMNAGRSPKLQIRCLPPGSSKPVTC